MRDEAIVTEGLRRHFGPIKAVDGVDLAAPAGTVLGLLGPNGAGKTTIVRILTTLLDPDGGSARVAGFDVVRDAEALRSVIGLAGQYAAVDENLTGRENLDLVGRLYHLGRSEAAGGPTRCWSASSSPTPPTGPSRPTRAGCAAASTSGPAWSAGPRCCSWTSRPPAWTRAAASLWDVIRELVNDGTTLLLTTQYLEEADRLADHIAVIDGGRVIAEGTTDELKSRVGGDLLALRVADRARVAEAAAAIADLGSGAPQVVAESGEVSLPVREGASILAEVVRRLDAAGLEISDLALGRPSLDDVFLALTGHVAEAAGEDGEETEPPGAAAGARQGAAHEHRRRPPPHPPPPALVDLRRRRRRHPAQPLPLRPRPDPAAVLDHPAGHVRAAVHLRVRRRHPGAGVDNYIDYLMAGILAQTVIFGSTQTGVGLAEDMSRGMVDRFRPAHGPLGRARRAHPVRHRPQPVRGLPHAGGGHPGRFRFHAGVVPAIGAVGLALAFGLAFSWISALIGLSVRDVESAQAAGFVWVFPLVFASSAFVPVETMPGWLQAFADINPVTVTVNALRALTLGGPTTAGAGGPGLDRRHPAGVRALAVNRYRRAAG